jgi:endonuclease/exonuclease/phosphatase family metal-dependent hydrolase
MSEKIKVVSFNVEFCVSVTRGYWQYLEYFWKYLIPHKITAIYETIDMIQEEGADIAIITEMEGVSRRTHHKDYMKMILESTQLKNSAYYPVNRWPFDLGNRGNAIATRAEIIDSKNVRLHTTIEKRYLSIARVMIKKQAITILTAHLSLGRKDRSRQFKQIVEVINSINEPIIFAGDLNTQDDKELSALNNTRLKRIETTNTFPSWKPKRRIDYIYYSPEFELLESYVLDKIKVSDHLPVIAELRLKNNFKKNVKDIAKANRIVRRMLRKI